MRSSRRQLPQFTRPWPNGRLSATTLLVSLVTATATAQWAFAIMDQGGLFRHTLVVDWLALTAETGSSSRLWQFATYTFLHANPLHLLVNGLILYFAGREVESIVGRRHLFALYTLSCVSGGVVQWFAMSQGWIFPGGQVFGATSGAVALTVAYASILPDLEQQIIPFGRFPALRTKWLGISAMVIAGLLCFAPIGRSMGAVAMLVAGATAWIYVKELGFGNPLAIQRLLYRRRERAARLDRMPLEQFMAQEIDPILDKIAREGVGSLSRDERRLLAQGQEKIRSKAKDPV